MEHFQQYVPVDSETSTISIPGVGEKEVHSDRFHHILFGGDLLTESVHGGVNTPEAIPSGGRTA